MRLPILVFGIALSQICVTNGQDTLTPLNQTPLAQSETSLISDDNIVLSVNDPQSSCQTGCQPQGTCQDRGLLGFGLIRHSDRAFDSFISPMTNPVFFEDPRALSEARTFFLRHKVPLAAGGGDVQLFAVQLRARLSDNVSLIATKDGYFSGSNALVGDGWADTAFGFKFNLLRDTQSQRLLSSGFTFEMPTGEASAQQGNGHGEFNFFMTGARKLGRCSHLIAAGGIRVPLNNTDESLSSYFSAHIDYNSDRARTCLRSLTGSTGWRQGVTGQCSESKDLTLSTSGLRRGWQ